MNSDFFKRISDIEVQNGQIRISRNIGLTVKDLENQISELVYSGEKRNVDQGVENFKFPPFIQIFYFLFFKRLKIPTETEFVNTYFENFGEVKNDFFHIEGRSFALESVKARILRTYPSLIRDIHFIILLEQSRIFDTVRYSLRNDYFDGVDIWLEKDKIVYALSIFLNSNRSNFYKNQKRFRHDYSNIREIELRVEKATFRKVGNIFLMGMDQVLEIFNKIENYGLE